MVKVFAEISENLLFCDQYKFSFHIGERAKRAENCIAGRQNKTDGGRNPPADSCIIQIQSTELVTLAYREGEGGDYCENFTLTSKYSDEFCANRQEGNQCYFVGKL